MLKLIALGALGYAGYKYMNRNAAGDGASYAGDRGKTGDIYNIDETNPADRAPAFTATKPVPAPSY